MTGRSPGGRERTLTSTLRMDALIFLLILATLVAMWRGRRALAAFLFILSLVAVALLFRHHATDVLPISL